MPAKSLPFGPGEYARRLDLTRKEMRARDLELLFIEDPSNLAWLTGYDGWSFYVHQGALVLHDEDPIWWGRAQDAEGAYRTIWMAEARVSSYSDDFVQSAECHPMQDLAALVREKGHGAGRIGLELDNYYFSAKAWKTLCDELPQATLVDATGLVNWQRAVKSSEEVVFMRRAAAISEKMIDGVLARIEPGMAKNELVAEIYADAIRGVPGAWGDYAAIAPMLPSGPDAAAPHLTWDGRPFESGMATFFELSGCYRRYHAPLCRTVFLGKPPQRLRDAEAAVAEGLETGLEVARAGARAGDVARALQAALAKAGIERQGRCGYAVGLSYPPDWGERTISFRPADETVLQAGMTFHFMPGLWMDGWGLEITESILICDDAPAECLSDRPRRLFVKD